MKALALALILLLQPPAPPAAEDLAPGIRLFDSQRFDEARAFFETYAAGHPKSAAAAFYLGRIHLEKKDGEKAADWLQRAVTLDRDNSDLHRWLARAYAVAAGQANPVAKASYVRDARAELEKAVQLNPKNLLAREDLVNFYLRTPEALGGSLEQARQEAQAMRKIDPVAGRMMLANIHFFQKEPAAAEEEYRKAVQETPGDPRPRMALGLHYQYLSRWAEAFDAFEGILQVEPGHWPAIYQIGRTGALSGQRLDRAEECLKRYLGHTPGTDEPPLAGAHFRLGMVLARKGDTARAREHYRTSLELDPTNAEVREALDRLPAGPT